MPTCLDLAGVHYPQEFKNRQLTPLEGFSLKNVLLNKPWNGHDAIFWEHEGSRAIRKGNWKLVAEIDQPWELYDLDADRSETNNLAAKYPNRVKALETEYLQWAQKVGAVDWNKIKSL